MVQVRWAPLEESSDPNKMRAISSATYIETKAWMQAKMVTGESANQFMEIGCQWSVKKAVDMALLADREGSKAFERSRSPLEQTNNLQSHLQVACHSNLHRGRDHLSIRKRGHHTVQMPKATEEARNNNQSERITSCEKHMRRCNFHN